MIKGFFLLLWLIYLINIFVKNSFNEEILYSYIISYWKILDLEKKKIFYKKIQKKFNFKLCAKL